MYYPVLSPELEATLQTQWGIMGHIAGDFKRHGRIVSGYEQLAAYSMIEAILHL